MSYWDRVLALSYRLQASVISRGHMLSGERPRALVAELRARAAAIDPGEDVPLPQEARPITLGEWLRGIRTVVNGVPQVATWVQPINAETAIKLGEYRSYNGQNWRSLHPANVWTPAEGALWTQEDPTLDGETGPPVVYAPWAAGLNVEVGERYTYGGLIYRVIQAHLTQAGWTPPAVPALFADEGPIPA